MHAVPYTSLSCHDNLTLRTFFAQIANQIKVTFLALSKMSTVATSWLDGTMARMIVRSDRR